MPSAGVAGACTVSVCFEAAGATLSAAATGAGAGDGVGLANKKSAIDARGTTTSAGVSFGGDATEEAPVAVTGFFMRDSSIAPS